jgi:hypothetical protein
MNGTFDVESAKSVVPTGLVLPLFASISPTSELVGYSRASRGDAI